MIQTVCADTCKHTLKVPALPKMGASYFQKVTAGQFYGLGSYIVDTNMCCKTVEKQWKRHKEETGKNGLIIKKQDTQNKKAEDKDFILD